MKKYSKNLLKYLIVSTMIFLLNSCFTLVKKEQSLIVKKINSYAWIDLMPAIGEKKSNVFISEEVEIVNSLSEKVIIKNLELYFIDEGKDRIDFLITESNPQLPIILNIDSSQIFFLKGQSTRGRIDPNEMNYKAYIRIYYNYNDKELRKDQLLGNVQIEKVY